MDVSRGGGEELTVSVPPETPGLERGEAVTIGWDVEAGAAFAAVED